MIFMSLIQVGEVLMPQKYMSKAYRNNTLDTKRHPKLQKSGSDKTEKGNHTFIKLENFLKDRYVSLFSYFFTI